MIYLAQSNVLLKSHAAAIYMEVAIRIGMVFTVVPYGIHRGMCHALLSILNLIENLRFHAVKFSE